MKRLYFKDIDSMKEFAGNKITRDDFLNHHCETVYRWTVDNRDDIYACAIYVGNKIVSYACLMVSLLSENKPVQNNEAEKVKANTNDVTKIQMAHCSASTVPTICYFKSSAIMNEFSPFSVSITQYYKHQCEVLMAVSNDVVVKYAVKVTAPNLSFNCECASEYLTLERPNANTDAKMETKSSTRKQCLEDAVKCICSDRNNQYGEPEDNFKIIADYWTTYLNGDRALTAQDVANMMILFKLGRLTVTNGTYDTYVDIAGYAGCGAEILHEN